MNKIINNAESVVTARQTRILEHSMDCLGVSDVTLMLYANDKLLDRYGTEEIRIDALLQPVMLERTYHLVVRSDESVRDSVLCHEMVHLEQYTSGRLTCNPQKGVFFFEGEEYDSSVPYDDRPWEREAFGKQTKLLKSFKRLYGG